MKVIFRDFIDGELESLGYADRSKFIRDAIREKLIAMGKDVPQEFALPPGRSGKGGRKPFRYPPYHPSAAAMNDRPNSKPASGAAKLARRAGGEKV
ncbi:MAG TPA: ribbon-helix-helix domain-containing protein [Verrucomicrobiae bacterium]|nr:ribbon-helix-helix domain-containing protein [Verrucomicrobiae bacterium]